MNKILLINKQKGYTSQDVVSKVKKILNIKKAGHTGTLDPMATGVLPICLNNATKLSKYLIEHNKTYIAILKLGEKKSTGDSEGTIVEQKNVNKDIYIKQNDAYTKIENALKSFLGETVQTPPIYSAIKVNGKKLYEYARNNEEVEIPKRVITIYNINLKNVDESKDEITFEVSCSKGTYIRVLCENIAEKLDTVGYMKELKRTKVNEFKIEDSITLEELENINKSNKLENINSDEELLKINSKKFLYFPEEILEVEKIILNKKKTELFLNGVMLSFNLKDGIYKIYFENDFLGYRNSKK